MSREYSRKELEVVAQAEQELRTLGLIIDQQDGAQAADHNSEKIVTYLDQNPSIPVTVQTILTACQQMKDELYWKSQEQTDFENIYQTLTSQEKQAFDAWRRPQRLVNNHANNATILKYLKQSQRYEVTARTLLQASVDRIVGQLEWESLPETSRRGHQDDGTGFFRKETDPRYRNGKLNHAHQAESKQTAPEPDPSESRWREMALALRGNSHSKTAELERIHGRNWRETYELRKKALSENPAIVNSMGAS